MLDRSYKLKLDLQFRCNNSNMEFNQFDKNTSDFFIQINNWGDAVDLSKVVVLKPNSTTDAQFLEIKENSVYADLKPSMKDLVGQYQCRAMAVIGDETVITDIFTYTVSEDKLDYNYGVLVVENDLFITQNLDSFKFKDENLAYSNPIISKYSK